VTAPRKVPVHPAMALHKAREAATAAANRKAELHPEQLTAEELELIPGRKVLELGNAGKLQHLGIGLPFQPATPARTPPKKADSSPSPTIEDLTAMSGEQISRLAAAGRLSHLGIGARRRRRAA
jgi:hypothetical protein